MSTDKWFIRIVFIGLGFFALGCNENSSPDLLSDSGMRSPDSKMKSLDSAIKAFDSKIASSDGEIKSSDGEMISSDGGKNLDGWSVDDLSIDKNIQCTPDCSGRVCGPDPVCGTSCGPACATGQCNSQGQCVAVSSSWAIGAGGSEADNGFGIAVDVIGNSLVVGTFSGQATFGTTTLTSKGNHDMFLAKVSPSGDMLWAINAGGTGEDYGWAVAVDTSGNALVTGSFSGQAIFGATTLISKGGLDVFVARVSPSGDVLWAIGAGGSDDNYGFGAAVDGSGNALVTGAFWDDLIFGSTTLTSKGSADVFVAKIDSAGNPLWAINAGGSKSDKSYDIAVDGSGNAFIAGTFQDQATFGSTNLISKGDEDVFVAKVSPSGDVLWAINAGGKNFDDGYCIAVDASGHAFVMGKFSGQATFGTTTLTSKGAADVFLIMVSPSGEIQWAIPIGGYWWEEGRDIAMDVSGNALITGNFEGECVFGSTNFISKGDADLFVAKVSPHGDVLWATSGGGIETDSGHGIEVDGNGNALVAGSFQGQATFDGTNLTSKGQDDVFVTKIELP